MKKALVLVLAALALVVAGLSIFGRSADDPAAAAQPVRGPADLVEADPGRTLERPHADPTRDRVPERRPLEAPTRDPNVQVEVARSRFWAPSDLEPMRDMTALPADAASVARTDADLEAKYEGTDQGGRLGAYEALYSLVEAQRAGTASGKSEALTPAALEALEREMVWLKEHSSP
jgi:hypothetical protein